MRILLIIIVLCVPAFSYDANDVNNFAEDWLTAAARSDFNTDGNVNFIDWAMLAADFDGFPYVPPTVQDVNVLAMQSVGTWFELNGSVDRYIITSLPAHGTLYDTLITYDTSALHALKIGTLKNMAAKRRPIAAVPYKVANRGKWLYYLTTDATDANFTYVTNDGTANSNPALVNIDVVPFDNNSVYFDGSGYITIPDNNAIDFDDSFSLTFWIKTNQQYAGIMQKRDGGAGFEISIEAGRLKVSVWDPNNNRYDLRGYLNIATDEWIQLGIARDANTMIVYAGDTRIAQRFDLPVVSFDNGTDFIIGKTSSRYFTGNIDRLSFWPYMDDFGSMMVLVFEERGGPGGGLFVPTNHLCRFHFDEGSGNTINTFSMITFTPVVGTFSDVNHVRWIPTEQPLFQYKPQFHTLGGY